MDDGIRVELAVDSPRACPVASVSADGTPVTSVTWSSVPSDGEIVEEFTAPGDVDREGVTAVFATEAGTRYRFRRERDGDCICELVEALGCPVADVRAEDGTLVLTFHAPDVDAVREIVTDARDRFGGISLRSLRRDGEGDSEFVLVDRSALTDRQREVLETATEMGYFDYPKGANAGEVAAELDISVSTLSEHLAAAQSKVLDAVLE
ncbi:MAG: helix-turn-helix domain-containing protein [Haloarculaceae archaeon]